jgi:hypothetical protein
MSVAGREVAAGLLILLVLPVARARADGPMCTIEDPDTPPASAVAPAAPAVAPPAPAVAPPAPAAPAPAVAPPAPAAPAPAVAPAVAPPAPAAPAPAVAPPAPAAPAPAVAPPAPAPLRPPAPAPRATKVEWRDVFWENRYGAVFHAEKPYRNGRLLEGEALYLALDRPDLAEAYRKRQETKSGLAIASGIFLASTAVAVAIAKTDQKNGQAAPVGPLIGIGVCLTLTGAFVIANAATPADVVTADELRRLVDVHNSAPGP